MQERIRWTLAAAVMLAAAGFAARGLAQAPAAGGGPPRVDSTQPKAMGIGEAVEQETRNLEAQSFPEREAALTRLRALIGRQVEQRAEIQGVLDELAADLAKQERALAVVNGSESQARVEGLLEMEGGISRWAAQTMSEPAERRRKLLAWGISTEITPVLARAYAQETKVRVAGVKELGKLDQRKEDADDPPDQAHGRNADATAAIDWTLARLINDPEEPVRAAAMAACWYRAPSGDLIAALWHRAVEGPMEREDATGGSGADLDVDEVAGGALHVDFPGGDPLQYDDSDGTQDYGDAHLACDILIHLNSPRVAEDLRTMVAGRVKAGRMLSGSTMPDLALTTDQLVEAYKVKEAIPLLAAEALGTQSEETGAGFGAVWTRRTLAMGAVATLTGQDPENFGLRHVHPPDDTRGWAWAVDAPRPMNRPGPMPQPDGQAVQAFYKWWLAHHAEYGVKEEPSKAGLPVDNERLGAQGGIPGRGINPGGPMMRVPLPLPAPAGAAAPANAPGTAPASAPAGAAAQNAAAPGAPASQGAAAPEKGP